MPPKRIAICGRICAGKTTLASYLEEHFGFKRLSFAEPIKRYAAEIFNMTTKNRALIQDLGQKLREIDDQVWVKHMEREIDRYSDYDLVIDDLRFPCEFHMLCRQNFTCIRLIVDPEVQLSRIKALYGDEAEGHILRLQHESENYCDVLPVRAEYKDMDEATGGLFGVSSFDDCSPIGEILFPSSPPSP